MPEQIISSSGIQYGLNINKDGSINTLVTGSVFIGSVTAQVDSVYIQSGNSVHLGSAWNQIGSVYVSNDVPISGNITTGSEVYIMNSVGISGVNDIGSVVIKSAPVLGVSGAKLDNLVGSVGVTALPSTLGSVYIKSNKVGVSGTAFYNMLGSVRISAPPLGISGTTFTDGKMTGSMAMKGIGSVIISSSTKLGVSGIVEISGITTDFTTTLKQYMDYEGTYQPVYIGLALPGVGSETAGWMIRKNIYENDLNVAVLFGSGNTNFDKKWSERSGIYAEYS